MAQQREREREEELTKHRFGSSMHTAIGTSRFGCLNGLRARRDVSTCTTTDISSREEEKTNMMVAAYLTNCSYWCALAGMFRATTVRPFHWHRYTSSKKPAGTKPTEP
jgi:hypothetical protein